LLQWGRAERAGQRRGVLGVERGRPGDEDRSHLHQTSPQRSHRSTDQALSERLSFVTAGEQITDIVKTLLNC
jgi:hypothetical protein